ncbi:DUF4258 domain-containing protein [Patescibacteria group bacterium]
MDRDYKGLVWTNHALERMEERGIAQSDAWATFSSPEQSKAGSSSGSTVYYRTWGNHRIEVVAKKEDGKWIIMSVWSKLIHKAKSKTPKSFWESMSDLFKMLRRKN